MTVKQGEVWKLMDDEKTWKKRFLVITERSLYFYKSSLRESEPKPIKISLTRIDRVHDGQKRRNSLVVSCVLHCVVLLSDLLLFCLDCYSESIV